MVSHFAASASSRNASSSVREQRQMHRRLGVRPVHPPRFVGGEAQHRRQPFQDRVADDVDRGQRRLARQRRRRVAIQRVLADVEIERRQFGVHEGREASRPRSCSRIRHRPCARSRPRSASSMQHQPLEFGHVGRRDRIARLEVMQRAEHPADRVAQLAVGLDGVLQDFRADALVVGIVGGADPEPQDIGAGILRSPSAARRCCRATSTSCGRSRPA